MRLLTFFVGVLLFIGSKGLAAGSDSFSEFDPNLGVTEHPMADQHTNQIPPPPQIMPDSVSPSQSSAQGESRKYKPKYKVGKNKSHKKTAMKAKKKTHLIARNTLHPGNRNPAYDKKCGVR